MWTDAYYINLAHRIDRHTEIRNELDRLGISACRFDAVREGAVGCNKSHLLVLKDAKARGLESVLILEDDFECLVTPEVFWSQINAFKQPYDVVLICYNLVKSDPCNEGVQRVWEARTTAAYVVHSRCYDAIIARLEECTVMLAETGKHWEYAIDIAWTKLMSTHEFYALTPRLGKQRKSFSDLRGAVTDYGI